MKINRLGNKISWFGKYSGYECISDYFPDGTLVEVTAPDENFIHKIIGKLYKSFKKWNVKSTEVYAELSFIKKMNNSLISHILYVENHLHTLSLNKIRKKILIGTIHLPFSVWRQEELNQLKYLENAIILYEEELDKFSKYVDRDKLHVIRHGVDISFFKPDKSKVIDKNKIVFIGHYLRNFEMFIEVYDLLQDMEIGKNLNFHLIIR